MAENKIQGGGDTPTQQIIKNVTGPCTTTDSRGRVIHLRKPGVLSQYRLVEMVGASAASNPTYMAMVIPLAYITQIDDDNAIVMETKNELEALIERLDDDGISAVIAKVGEVWGSIDPKDTAEKIKK